MQLNRQNLKWAGRMASILLVVCLADVLVVMFAHRPLPYVAVASGLIPLLTVFFVVIPMVKAEKDYQSAQDAQTSDVRPCRH